MNSSLDNTRSVGLEAKYKHVHGVLTSTMIVRPEDVHTRRGRHFTTQYTKKVQRQTSLHKLRRREVIQQLLGSQQEPLYSTTYLGMVVCTTVYFLFWHSIYPKAELIWVLTMT